VKPALHSLFWRSLSVRVCKHLVLNSGRSTGKRLLPNSPRFLFRLRDLCSRLRCPRSEVFFPRMSPPPSRDKISLQRSPLFRTSYVWERKLLSLHVRCTVIMPRKFFPSNNISLFYDCFRRCASGKKLRFSVGDLHLSPFFKIFRILPARRSSGFRVSSNSASVPRTFEATVQEVQGSLLRAVVSGVSSRLTTAYVPTMRKPREASIPPHGRVLALLFRITGGTNLAVQLPDILFESCRHPDATTPGFGVRMATWHLLS